MSVGTKESSDGREVTTVGTSRDVPTEGGFDDFYRREYGAICAYLRSAGAEWEEARDVAQDAMMLLTRQWSSVEQPWAWLRTVAMRIFLKKRDAEARDLRRWLRDLPSLIRDLDDETSDLGFVGHAGAPADQTLLHRVVLDAIGRMPQHRRTVSVLYFMEDWTTTQIADYMGVSQSTVRSHVQAARDQLQRLVEREVYPY
ncbi:RNA polymerase sigma factor [Phytohabitans houttuyneae]|uniref:RNA polymerase sigma factor n=1 Tax=Phytohabitans houttuyneae TaxID=1076126 RepID=UPI0015678C32|nr:sigma-70 family RNA polymerase sigma factor [Phytohabitans houttuyneae]